MKDNKINPSLVEYEKTQVILQLKGEFTPERMVVQSDELEQLCETANIKLDWDGITSPDDVEVTNVPAHPAKIGLVDMRYHAKPVHAHTVSVNSMNLYDEKAIELPAIPLFSDATPLQINPHEDNVISYNAPPKFDTYKCALRSDFAESPFPIVLGVPQVMKFEAHKVTFSPENAVIAKTFDDNFEVVDTALDLSWEKIGVVSAIPPMASVMSVKITSDVTIDILSKKINITSPNMAIFANVIFEVSTPSENNIKFDNIGVLNITPFDGIANLKAETKTPTIHVESHSLINEDFVTISADAPSFLRIDIHANIEAFERVPLPNCPKFPYIRNEMPYTPLEIFVAKPRNHNSDYDFEKLDREWANLVAQCDEWLT